MSGARFVRMSCSTGVRAEALKRAIVVSGVNATNVAQHTKRHERLFDLESNGIFANANEACIE